MEDDAVLLVQRADEIAQLRPQNALQRPLVRRDHVDFDSARAKRGGDLKPDEAGAQHDRSSRRLGAFDNGATVGERTQQAHLL